MKTAPIFFACLILSLGLGAYVPAELAQTPAPTPFDVSRIDFSKISEEDIAKTEAHRAELRKQLDQNLQNVADVAADQGSTLSDVSASTLAAANAFAKYKKATEDQITKGNAAIAALNHVLKKLHLAKLIANVLLLAAAAFVAVKIPPPIGLYAAGAIFVFGSAAIWLFL